MRLDSTRANHSHRTTTFHGQLSEALSEPPRRSAEHTAGARSAAPEESAGKDAAPSADTARLDRLEELADHGEADELLALARPELHRLTEGLRALLDEHRPDGQGRCRTCPGGLRARRWPCGVWRTIYTELVGEDPDQLGDTARGAPERAGRRSPRHRLGGERAEGTSRPSVPVVSEPIVSGGTHDPGRWDTGELEALPAEDDRSSAAGATDADTFEGAAAGSPAAGTATAETTSVPPLGGHLETDHTRIHRAGVADRTPGRRR
ncbi:hypothetical protein FHR84_002819 [Actinopolyspora biskrensis]|uniref:Uncharacterized protein n=1 Tax=Actinopolyspora biskrensis TaxID=1470178 RepID=A0A852YXX6_9ACTN|nr:hypothetical protein [Actinopolyspora biskrensis]NYH79481.1 hypothetical protein [Actinopolyspora biskrensis]